MRMFVSVLLVLSASATAEFGAFLPDTQWKLRKDKRGIQVYTAAVDGSKYRAVFSSMEVETQVESIVALLLDLPNCRAWASMCKEARLEHRLTDTEYIVYGRNDLPFPVRDRDSYSVNNWFFNRVSGVVVMNSQVDTTEHYPLEKNVVRLNQARVSWRVMPKSNGKVLIENYAHIDPNGRIPIWLTNALIVDAPYKALRKMRALLKTGKYNEAKVDFLHPKTATSAD